MQQLQRLDRLAGLIVFGSPYLWEELNAVLHPSIPAGFSPGQMPEAQRQLLSRLLQPQAESLQRSDFTD